jgi:hypothetical protein
MGGDWDEDVGFHPTPHKGFAPLNPLFADLPRKRGKSAMMDQD